MEVGAILQVILFVLLSLSIVLIVLGVLNAVPKGKKGKSYRYSKRGDAWITKFKG